MQVIDSGILIETQIAFRQIRVHLFKSHVSQKYESQQQSSFLCCNFRQHAAFHQEGKNLV